MANYLKKFPGASDIKRQLGKAADKLMALYVKNDRQDWHWFENELTYDNAILPYAMFVAGMSVDDKYIEIAEKSCEFLLENTFDGNHFSFIGCNGWYKRKGQRASFDQQPVEVASTVMMFRAAYKATGNKWFLKLQRKAFDWFLGQNDLRTPLYDFRTYGCCDGLMQNGVNCNQGAESTLSFLLGLLSIIESYTITDKTVEEARVVKSQGVKTTGGKRVPIKSMSSKRKAKRRQIEELA